MSLELVTDIMAMPQRQHTHAAVLTRPDEWSVGDWQTIITSVGAVGIWLYRKTLKSALIWTWNTIKMPTRIAEMFKEINAVRDQSTLALALSRVTWRTIDRPIWESDTHGMCMGCNPYMLRVLARQESEILGNGWRNIVAEQDRDKVDREWTNAVKEGRDFYLHYNWISASGELIPIIASGSRLMDVDGNILGYIGFVTLLDK